MQGCMQRKPCGNGMEGCYSGRGEGGTSTDGRTILPVFTHSPFPVLKFSQGEHLGAGDEKRGTVGIERIISRGD